MPPVISVEDLSKVYRLGQIGTGTFSYDLALWWARLRGRPNPLLKIGETDHGNRVGEELWALKDVSFTVEQGEVLGIIGRNGAGKSTLLKILSRVTAPTSGKVKIRGRVASLLEVGTGFHPELTGRENIYLNGAILGMSRREIDRKFDEIVDFAEIEKFIDTPVKRYSSGMYVRLAFAVAAHLEPEILVVDEVLAVGDAEFQKKCLGKMGNVAKQGRTVLFVSHNMAAVAALCSNTIVLIHGCVGFLGDTGSAINHYLTVAPSKPGFHAGLNDTERVGTGRARFFEVRLLNEQQQEADVVAMGRPLYLEMSATCSEESRLQFAVVINDSFGRTVIHAVDQDDMFNSRSVDGTHRVRVIFPNVNLYPGQYTIGIWCGYENEDYDYIRECLQFQVEQGAVSGRATRISGKQAVFFMSTKWENLTDE